VFLGLKVRPVGDEDSAIGLRSQRLRGPKAASQFHDACSFHLFVERVDGAARRFVHCGRSKSSGGNQQPNIAALSSPEMVFRQASCPAFTISTNGQNGILHAVGKKFICREFFSSGRGFRQFVGCTWQVFLCFQE